MTLLTRMPRSSAFSYLRQVLQALLTGPACRTLAATMSLVAAGSSNTAPLRTTAWKQGHASEVSPQLEHLQGALIDCSPHGWWRFLRDE
jgi:hypothetical protein